MNNQKALLKAVDKGKLADVQRLVDAGGVDLNPPVGDSGANPLLEASMRGHVDIVRFLLDRGADVNQADEDGSTALMWAAANSHADVVLILLQRGAHINSRSSRGKTALHSAADCDQLDVIRALLDHGADRTLKTDTGLTAGDLAVEHEQQAVVELLRDYGTQPVAILNNQKALLKAINDGNIPDVQRLVDAGGVDLNPPAGPSHPPNQPLLLASYGGHVDIARFLLDRGADVNQVDEAGDTALIWAAIMSRVDVVQPLLERGANLNAPENNGWTALHIAAMSGDVDVIRVLLDHGADCTRTDETGKTAEDAALNHGQPAAAAILRDHAHIPPVFGPSPATSVTSEDDAGKSNQKALLTAVEDGNLAEVQSLVDMGGVDLNPPPAEEYSDHPLFLASAGGHVDIVRFLLDRGADVNQADKDGGTALLWALYRTNVVRLLLKRGAHVNARDTNNATVLHHVAQEGFVDVIRVLLDHGADRTLKRKDGKTAEDLARDEDKKEAVELLRRYVPAPPATTNVSNVAPQPSPAVSTTPSRNAKGSASPVAPASSVASAAATDKSYREGVPKAVAGAVKDHQDELRPLVTDLLARVRSLQTYVPRDRPSSFESVSSWENDLTQALTQMGGTVVKSVAGCFTTLSSVCGLLSGLYEAYKGVAITHEAAAQLVDRCSRLSTAMTEYALHLAAHPPKPGSATQAMYASMEEAIKQALNLIERWSQKGKQKGFFKKLVGKLSEMATNKQYQEDFKEVNALLTQCFQDLANDATFQTRMAIDVAKDQVDATVAQQEDVANMQASIARLANDNAEFREELQAQWDTVSSALSTLGVDLRDLGMRLGTIEAGVRQLVRERAADDVIRNHVIDWSDLTMERAPLDSGGFGTVHRGTYNGDEVAIKLVTTPTGAPPSPKDVSRLKQEAQMQMTVCVGNVRRIVEVKGVVVGSTDGRVGIVMELMHESLYDRIAASSAMAFPWKQACRWLHDAADGLRRVHKHKMVHGDVKSRNIMLTAAGEAKISDFGLSRDTRNMTTMTASGAAKPVDLCTPVFTAPEIWNGSKASLKSDVYAFAITCWEVAARAAPLEHLAQDRATLISRVVAGTRPSLDDIPEEYPDAFREALQRWWAPEPRARPDMEAVVAELKAMLDAVA